MCFLGLHRKETKWQESGELQKCREELNAKESIIEQYKAALQANKNSKQAVIKRLCNKIQVVEIIPVSCNTLMLISISDTSTT